jgi:ubiquinone/menaquinone biosynthesis C-methylase UbiE
VHVRIEHCTVCLGYRDRALALAEALRERLGATVEVVDGTLGQFDVLVDGELISTRGDNLFARLKPPRLPKVSDVVADVERQLVERRTAPSENVVGKFGPEDAKRFFDRFGRRQDVQFYERPALSHLVAHSDFGNASAVFELGCGTGRLAECLLKKHLPDEATYAAIDISTTMVRIAAARLSRWGRRATVRQADGTATLPYSDQSFDRFVATYVLDLLAESAISHVLAEARRVMRLNGKLCVTSLTAGRTPLSRVVGSIWTRVYGLDPRLVGGCRALRLSTLLRGAGWTVDHTHVICSWGICSEIVIAH